MIEVPWKNNKEYEIVYNSLFDYNKEDINIYDKITDLNTYMIINEENVDKNTLIILTDYLDANVFNIKELLNQEKKHSILNATLMILESFKLLIDNINYNDTNLNKNILNISYIYLFSCNITTC